MRYYYRNSDFDPETFTTREIKGYADEMYMLFIDLNRTNIRCFGPH